MYIEAVSLERKFGDVERLSTASLTNGVSEKMFGTTGYNNPLGASYPPVKQQASQPAQSQKSLPIGKALNLFLASVYFRLTFEQPMEWNS